MSAKESRESTQVPACKVAPGVGWGRDSTERVGQGKGEDEQTCACYHLLK